jgi:nucleoside-diphosphate-sugar epimerase
MRIFITGGSGDLGVLLARALEASGDTPVRMDVRPPRNPQRGEVIQGSILERPGLAQAMTGCQMAVHIAAWHGFHLVAGQKDAYDFWDLNATGTFNVFEAAARQGIQKVVYISSTSIGDRYGVYGHTKVIGEEIAQAYHQRYGMDVIVLRPGAFIPYWNTGVYASFVEFAQWYWKGAVHILDVLQAVTKSVELLKADSLPEVPVMYVGGAYEYTPADLANWDAAGPGSTFRKYYREHEQTALKYGLEITTKPDVFDIQNTREILGYQPTYSFMTLLQDLEKYGPKGPPLPEF